MSAEREKRKWIGIGREMRKRASVMAPIAHLSLAPCALGKRSERAVLSLRCMGGMSVGGVLVLGIISMCRKTMTLALA